MTNLVEAAGAALSPLDDDSKALLFDGAHTAHSFTEQPVTDDELSAIWDLAKWAPTSANFQPLRILYVQTPDARDRLVSHLNEGNKAKTLAAPAVAVLAMDTEFHEHIPTVLPFRPELKDVLGADTSRRLEAARFNSAMQAGYFVLAVRAVGLAAGPMGGFDAAALDADFFPDGRWKSILVVNIGHPDENAFRPRLPRLDHSESVTFA